eukprot:CAMPEP_0206419588 /NCGR_PEP_ID=MMETSP0324_2-20121206/239_1 /ASSEMBLY_ACC=CAM_ASM_000836 /TAXON_ID=2866 /ORGANISM="Crypthecodinium cohnii, Strain Seligo" /LENGTH=41 /DNA_ID= /DNA_START= /DNA_END= /DNA_ORIENTATION=
MRATDDSFPPYSAANSAAGNQLAKNTSCLKPHPDQHIADWN